MRKLKIGILGCASIAERFLIPALIESDNFELIGVASRSHKKGCEFSSKFNIENYIGYDSLLNCDIDAVYIPLPNSLHYEWIKKALNTKKHVLVEKSLACTYPEVVELVNLAEKNSVALMENFQFRFHNQLAFIMDIIKSRKLGTIKNVRSSFGFPPFKEINNIRYSKELGGGSLLDAGAYTLKVSDLICGEKTKVIASYLNFDNEKKVDINGSGFLINDDLNITSQIAFGFDNFYQNILEIWFQNGVLKAERIFTAGPGVKAKITLVSSNSDSDVYYFMDNHFLNMLNYFHNLCFDKNTQNLENESNLRQSKLIDEFIKNAIIK